eukprot:GEMP01038873.1.p1 GENE.GEMP01038873.1~~GEMP01038873.1.p1  ORF type:complete len:417 (+),score=123.23 GEMP01038873.1:37-1287(+)
MGPRAAPVDPWESDAPPLMSRAQRCLERIERIRITAGRVPERRTSTTDAANNAAGERAPLRMTVADSGVSHTAPERRVSDRPKVAWGARPIAIQRTPNRADSWATERPKVSPKSHFRLPNSEKNAAVQRGTPKKTAGVKSPRHAAGTHLSLASTSTSSGMAQAAAAPSTGHAPVAAPCENVENVLEDCPPLATEVVREGRPTSPIGGAEYALTSVNTVIASLRTACAEEERAEDAGVIPRTDWVADGPQTNVTVACKSRAADGRHPDVAIFLPDARNGQQATRIGALPVCVNVLKAQKDEFLRAHVAAGLMHQAHESMLIVEEDVQARLEQALKAAEERFAPLHTELNSFVGNCRSEILRLEKLLDEALARTGRLQEEYDHCRQALQDEANAKREGHRRVLQQRMEIEMNGALNLH